ncbi:hypothetical protein LP420_04075 [Massilia sp. B-10]|nr:hypothetical protein LP420_04075 [Massilia sp. B-10]
MLRLQQGDRTCQRACRASGARRGRSQPDRPARRGQDRTSARHRQRQRHDRLHAAINDALKTAIMQVNGTQVQATTATLNTFSKITGQLDVETGGESDSLKATATVQSSHFAESIVAQSQGVVSAFKVLKMSPAGMNKGGQFSADISATVAKFKAPADSGKIKIVVAPLRSDRASFDIGGRAV